MKHHTKCVDTTDSWAEMYTNNHEGLWPIYGTPGGFGHLDLTSFTTHFGITSLTSSM